MDCLFYLKKKPQLQRSCLRSTELKQHKPVLFCHNNNNNNKSATNQQRQTQIIPWRRRKNQEYIYNPH